MENVTCCSSCWFAVTWLLETGSSCAVSHIILMIRWHSCGAEVHCSNYNSVRIKNAELFVEREFNLITTRTKYIKAFRLM